MKVDGARKVPGDRIIPTKCEFVGIHWCGEKEEATIIAGNKRLAEPIKSIRKAKREVRRNKMKYAILASLAYVEINNEKGAQDGRSDKNNANNG